MAIGSHLYFRLMVRTSLSLFFFLFFSFFAGDSLPWYIMRSSASLVCLCLRFSDRRSAAALRPGCGYPVWTKGYPPSHLLLCPYPPEWCGLSRCGDSCTKLKTNCSSPTSIPLNNAPCSCHSLPKNHPSTCKPLYCNNNEEEGACFLSSFLLLLLLSVSFFFVTFFSPHF